MAQRILALIIGILRNTIAGAAHASLRFLLALRAELLPRVLKTAPQVRAS